jgi:hypothetical protein
MILETQIGIVCGVDEVDIIWVFTSGEFKYGLSLYLCIYMLNF